MRRSPMSCSEFTTSEEKRGHLSRSERDVIERNLREKTPLSEIARFIGRDRSTIRREIARGSVTQIRRNRYESKNPDVPKFIEYKVYFAEAGQREYDRHRQNCGSKNKMAKCFEMIRFVEDKILSQEKWSPDAAIGYAKAQGIFEDTFSTKTFYNWIDDGIVRVKNIDLPLKTRRRAKHYRRERKRKLGKSIDERPVEVEGREEFGHWEGDGIVGKDQKGFLISLVERKTGVGFLFDVGDKKDDKIVLVLDNLQEQYGPDFSRIFKTITFDNGSEFAASAEMEREERVKVYYAHPYSSFERGTNENWNGIVRRFIPKGSSFEGLKGEITDRIAYYINTLPRKRFGYKTPLQMWEEETSALKAA
jgi:IS30 family transposase